MKKLIVKGYHKGEPVFGSGHFRPDINYKWDWTKRGQQKGQVTGTYTFGTVVAEVEVDLHTVQVKVLQEGRGGAAAPGAGAAKSAYFGQDDPLQRHLTNLATSGANQFGGATSGGQFAGGGVFTQGQHGAPAAAAPVAPAPAAPAPAANPAAQAALQAFGGGATSAVAPPPAAPAQFFGGPKPAEQVVAPPTYTNTFGGPESAAARAGFQAANRPSGAALLQSNPILSNMTGQQAPALSATATPIQPAPDAFGVQGGGNGSFEDLVNPRRARRDARTSGSWF